MASMEEQTTWKAHHFTLLVFGGIVFLCSLFFVLGMLVGAGQNQHGTDSATVATATAKAETADAGSPVAAKSANAAFEGLETGRQATSVVAAAPEPDAKPAASIIAAARKSEPPAPAAKAPVPAQVKMIYLQINALEKETAANKEVDELRKKGFSAIIAAGEGANKLYRVQVGPFSNAADAETAKIKLKSLGYNPIKK